LDNFIPKSLLGILQINNLHGLMNDFLNYETIIQKALSKNRSKEVQFIIEYILGSSDTLGLNWYSLMQDIPQLLCSTKYNINSFFHISAAEEDTTQSSEEEKMVFCNFERSLNHPDLP
jgi:hypothetical protein